MFSRTARLLLRPGWIEDARALAKALDDESITRNLFGVPAKMTTDDAEALLRNESEVIAPHFLLFARTGGAPRLVGGCGIAHFEMESPELAFWVARPFWGLGFATEACGALIRMAHAAGHHDIVSRPVADNKAAAHVLTKLGFRATGKSVQRHCQARGEDVACAVFEDSGKTPMRDDTAQELYLDRAPIAA